jgi:hypothetical protein
MRWGKIRAQHDMREGEGSSSCHNGRVEGTVTTRETGGV